MTFKSLISIIPILVITSGIAIQAETAKYTDVSVKDTVPVLTRFSNGTTKDSGQVLQTNNGKYFKNGVWKTFYNNGQLKDSVFFSEMKAIGQSKSFYNNGKLRLSVNFAKYGKDSLSFIKIFYYGKNGELKSESSFLDDKPFGDFKRYKKGEVVFWKEFNKGREVQIPSEFWATHDLIRGSIENQITSDRLLLLNESRKKILGNGTLLNLTMKGDTSLYRNLLVEGFNDHSLYSSRFSYDMTDRKDNLVFDSLKIFNLNEISSLSFSCKHPKAAEFSGKILKLTGVIIITEILLLPSIMGHPEYTFDKRSIPFFIAAPVFYIPGVLLESKSIRKSYEIKKGWKIMPKK